LVCLSAARVYIYGQGRSLGPPASFLCNNMDSLEAERPSPPPTSTAKVASQTASEVEDDKVKDLEGLYYVRDADPVAPPQAGIHARSSALARYSRPLTHLLVQLLFTGWWIASLLLHRKDKNWVVPFLLWLAITIRIVTFYVPAGYALVPLRWIWARTALVVYDRTPTKFRTLGGAAIAMVAICIGAFVPAETAGNTRADRAISLLGMLVIIAGFWATSKHRSKVNWRTVIVGMLAQYIIGIFVLRSKVGYDIFKFIADLASHLLAFAKQGMAFVIGAEAAAQSYWFYSVIPAIIFLISIVQLLFYLGFVQWFVKKSAYFVFWAMKVSGSEAVVAAATPFIGQGESAMLVRPFVSQMTKAELHQIMTCGFATISGSMLIAYIGMGLNAEVLVSSCIMSIPASLALSKLRYPETEESMTVGEVTIPETEEKTENALHAFAQGAIMGVQVALSIIGAILCIISAVALINGLLTWWGTYLNINEPQLTLQIIFGYVFYPVAFLMGVSRGGKDVLLVGRLIAEKVITVSA